VSNTAKLLAAVQDVACTDVVLRPGVYSPAGLPNGYLRFYHSNTHLWAAEPGSVVLQFGISMHTMAGSGLHGLVIDVADPANAVAFDSWGHTAAVVFWGRGEDMIVEDTRIVGHGQVHLGINAAQPKGLVLSRLEVDGFLRFGVRVGTSDGASAAPPVLTDLDVRNVGDPVWRTMPVCDPEVDPPGTDACYAPGTAEHGIWIGASGTLVDRARVRDVYWAGIITGAHPQVVADVVIRNADVNRMQGQQRGGTAIGVERITHNLLIERFCVGPDVRRGVHVEWNHNDSAQSPVGIVVRRGVVAAWCSGVDFDAGTLGSEVRSLHIRDAAGAGIVLHRNYPTGSCDADDVDDGSCNTTEWSEITFDLPPSSIPLTYAHLGSVLGQCDPP
jgi:hypothetical protein